MKTMSEYVWVPKHTLPVLAESETFEVFGWLVVDRISPGLQKVLKENGLQIETVLKGKDFAYKVLPKKVRKIKYTGKRYVRRGGEYVLIDENYTNWNNDPVQYKETKELFAKLLAEYNQKQKAKFWKFFEEGLLNENVSLIRISSNPKKERYVDIEIISEDEVVWITEKRSDNYFKYQYSNILLTRKKDYQGKILTIVVPEEYKGRVIGLGGENAKRISKELNAFCCISTK